MPKPVLTVVLGPSDAAAQRAHLARGALFVPEPVPAPEPFAEILVRVEAAAGLVVELDGRVLQILPGRGVALAFDDMTAAAAKLGPVLEAASGAAGGWRTRVHWAGTRPPIASMPEVAVEDRGPTGANDADALLSGDEAPAEERDESAKLRDEIAAMSANEKMQLALKGDRLARFLLLKEPNKALQSFILQNPRTTIDEVRYLAGFRQASPDALVTIAGHREWGNNAGVIAALVRNPKTPGATAVKLLDKVSMPDIRRLAKASDVPQPVQAAARRRVADAAR